MLDWRGAESAATTNGGGAANGGTITDTHTATLGAEMLLLL